MRSKTTTPGAKSPLAVMAGAVIWTCQDTHSGHRFCPMQSQDRVSSTEGPHALKICPNYYRGFTARTHKLLVLFLRSLQCLGLSIPKRRRPLPPELRVNAAVNGREQGRFFQPRCEAKDDLRDDPRCNPAASIDGRTDVKTSCCNPSYGVILRVGGG